MRLGDMDTSSIVIPDDQSVDKIDITDEGTDAEDPTEDSAQEEDSSGVISLEVVTNMAEDEINRISRASSPPEVTTQAVRLLRTSSEHHVSKILATADRLSRHAGRDFVSRADLKLARELASLWNGQEPPQTHAAIGIVHATDGVSTDTSAYDGDGPSSSIIWPEENESQLKSTSEDEDSTSSFTSSDMEMPMLNLDVMNPDFTNIDMSSIDEHISEGDDFGGWFKSYSEKSSEDGEVPNFNTANTNKKRKTLSDTDESGNVDMEWTAKRAKRNEN